MQTASADFAAGHPRGYPHPPEVDWRERSTFWHARYEEMSNLAFALAIGIRSVNTLIAYEHEDLAIQQMFALEETVKAVMREGDYE